MSETNGNVAAMREALKQVQIGFGNNIIGPIGDVPNNWEIDEAKRLHGIVDAALAVPARNCDRFQTASEAGSAFWEENKPQDGAVLFYEVLHWLYATAKEGGAE